MPAASALRAEKAIAERSRGAHPCVAQLASGVDTDGGLGRAFLIT